MAIEHILPNAFREREIEVTVVGCGGTGSSFLFGLPHLHQALRVWGAPGLHVTVVDPDRVSPTNCVRQPFAHADIGRYKSEVLVERINAFWNLSWKASATTYAQHTPKYHFYTQVPRIVVGCVDSRAARAEILENLRSGYWLDFGNLASIGQFVLGQVPRQGKRRPSVDRLPLVTELYPEVCDRWLGEDNQPSCSAFEALEKQEPFVNQTLAQAGLSMLTQLLRYGKLSFHGGFYNAKTGTIAPLAVDPTIWKRMMSKASRVKKAA